MADNTLPAGTQCHFCLEYHTNTQEIGGTGIVCFDCIKYQIVPQFKKALHREHDYPTKWGNTVLEPEDFVDWLGPAFVERYHRRKVEYDCSRNRIYCPHTIESEKAPRVGEVTNEHLALTETQKTDCDSQVIEPCGGFVTQATENAQTVTCGRCLGRLCGKCGVAVWDDATNHRCTLREVDNLVNDWVRGRDFQTCPSCKKSFALKDGCNHMVCPCSANFCFICGETANGDSDHWTGGRCSRWNHPEDENAQWDDPDEDADIPALIYEYPLDRVQRVTIANSEGFFPDGQRPEWFDFDMGVDVGFNVVEGRANFVGITASPNHTPNQARLRRRLNMAMARFFHGHRLTLVSVMHDLIPRVERPADWEDIFGLALEEWQQTALARWADGNEVTDADDGDEDDQAHEDDDWEDYEEDGEDDEEDGEENWPLLTITEAGLRMQHDYQFHVEMTWLVYLYQQWLRDLGRQPRDLNILGDAELVISLSGDANTLVLHRAAIETVAFRPETLTEQGEFDTRDFCTRLGQYPALLTELVRKLLRDSHVTLDVPRLT